MHHDYVLFITHLGARDTAILDALSLMPEVSVCYNEFFFTSPQSLTDLANACNRQKEARIYLGVLRKNINLQTKDLYDLCKFIYFVSNPIDALNHLINIKKYHPNQALNHYKHRLERMCLMSKYTDGILATNDNCDGLSKFLKLKRELHLIKTDQELTKFISNKILYEAQMIYDYYVPKIKSRCLKSY